MEFGFSCELYPSQRQLIHEATEIIGTNQVGIISSPTGTGKTISLLCTAMNFIRSKGDDDDLYSLLGTHNKTIVYYCSRTHSQLNQALNELKKNKNQYNAVILGSRKQYCLNTKINHISDTNILNEKCRELTAEDRCKFYENRTHYTGEIMDIEDTKNLGRDHAFCPYYYSKNRASDCEIVFLPYSLLFTKEGRKSLDIKLDGKILIIDEAHNIYDTIIQINSADIEWSDVRRISTAKGMSCNLVAILNSLLAFSRTIRQETIMSVPKFLMETKLSGFNMFDIEESIISNKLAQKNDLLVFFEFAKFLKLLTFSDADGRVIFNKNKIRFTPLNPKMYFKEIMKCRSVLFAGGTMEPIAHLKDIFPDIKYYSYPAVSTNFLSLIVPETASKKQIKLTYENRDKQVDDVVNTLVMLSNPVKIGGVVIFVPSKNVLSLIRQSSKVQSFRRQVCYEEDIVLENFKNNPSILFAVMGGRLSEGINFSDEMCRLLIVVGVPYPTTTLELEERTKHSKDYITISAMKNVNQTVGRAIRHKGDFAAIVFLDSRYIALKNKLSPWIMNSTQTVKPIEGLIQIGKFLQKNASGNN